MPTPGPTFTPAQQLANAEAARKEREVVAEINTKESTPVGVGMESPATAKERAANAQESESRGLKQTPDELSPTPKKA